MTVESEYTKSLRLEVLKIATEERFSGGDAGKAVEVAKTLYSFIASSDGDGQKGQGQ